MDTVSLAPSTPNTTSIQAIVIATAASSPTRWVFAAENAVPTRNSTQLVISVNASRVLAEFQANAPSVLLELKPLLTAQAAPTVVPMRFFKTDNVSARLDMPTIPLESVPPAVPFPMVS